ncbi:MAG: hypothetical protein ABSH20_19460 [Tepidisphaeraceae bacterium]
MTKSSRALATGVSLTLALLAGIAIAAEPRPTTAPAKAPAVAPAAGSTLATQESPLGQLPSKDARSLSISADNRHVAVLRKVSTTVDGKNVDKFIVSVDGKDQKEYDWIVANSLTFSADSSACAYVVQDSKGMYPVIGGVESKPCFEIVKSDIFAIPGGKGFAWFAKAKAGGKNYVVINGEDGKEYDEVGNLVFSPDGKHWAYAVRTGEKMYFLIDSKPTSEYDAVIGASFTWSPDNLHHAFSAIKGKGDGAKAVVVIDGKEVVEANSAGRVFFSPDSQRTAFVIGDAKSAKIYIDGKEAKAYDRILSETVRFSPDSKRVAYLAGRAAKGDDKGSTFYVVDGEETRSYEQIVLNSLMFSPDSKRFAFVVAKDLPGLPADKAKRFQAIIDTLGGAEYEDLRAAQFSPDSRHFAYLARRSNRTYAVVDNTEGVGYEAVSSLLYSAEGKHMAYIAFRDKNAFVVLDNIEGPNYQGIVEGTMSFSPDGRHLAFEARREKEGDKPGEKKLIPFFVVDKLETAEHGGSLRGSRIVWDESSRKLRAIILRDEGKIFLMDMELPG